jgi:hypothetical protein
VIKGCCSISDALMAVTWTVRLQADTPVISMLGLSDAGANQQ